MFVYIYIYIHKYMCYIYIYKLIIGLVGLGRLRASGFRIFLFWPWLAV